jgi:ribonuclease D
MTIRLHRGDLPDLSHYRTRTVAVDTETMGLALRRDRLCVVQLSPGDGSADVVQVPAEGVDAPNLKTLLADASILKIFHFARFDLAVLRQALGIMPARSTAPRSHRGWRARIRTCPLPASGARKAAALAQR